MCRRAKGRNRGMFRMASKIWPYRSWVGRVNRAGQATPCNFLGGESGLSPRFKPNGPVLVDETVNHCSVRDSIESINIAACFCGERN